MRRNTVELDNNEIPKSIQMANTTLKKHEQKWIYGGHESMLMKYIDMRNIINVVLFVLDWTFLDMHPFPVRNMEANCCHINFGYDDILPLLGWAWIFIDFRLSPVWFQTWSLEQKQRPLMVLFKELFMMYVVVMFIHVDKDNNWNCCMY